MQNILHEYTVLLVPLPYLSLLFLSYSDLTYIGSYLLDSWYKTKNLIFVIKGFLS